MRLAQSRPLSEGCVTRRQPMCTTELTNTGDYWSAVGTGGYVRQGLTSTDYPERIRESEFVYLSLLVYNNRGLYKAWQ